MYSHYLTFGFPENNTLKSIISKFNALAKDVHPDKQRYSPDTCHNQFIKLKSQYDEIRKELEDKKQIENDEIKIAKVKKWYQIKKQKEKQMFLKKQQLTNNKQQYNKRLLMILKLQQSIKFMN